MPSGPPDNCNCDSQILSQIYHPHYCYAYCTSAQIIQRLNWLFVFHALNNVFSRNVSDNTISYHNRLNFICCYVCIDFATIKSFQPTFNTSHDECWTSNIMSHQSDLITKLYWLWEREAVLSEVMLMWHDVWCSTFIMCLCYTLCRDPTTQPQA